MTGWDDDIFTNQAYTTRTYFDECYSYFPLSYINENHHADTGNKIIMPQSALETLLASRDDIDYPMLFQIQNTTTGQHSHCGVMEFTAEEGFVYLPSWMLENLQLQECDFVNLTNISLPKGNYIKIQPHATKFTTLPDHKAVLENNFRDFACLTTGDTIIIHHGEEKYMIDILETKPAWGVSLFETDCEVDVLPGLDYKEPEKISIDDVKQECAQKEDPSNSHVHDDEDTKLFPGIGRRLASDDHRCCFSVDESLKKLKITESSKTIDAKMHNKYSTEVRPPFARGVDGQTEKKVAQDQTDAAHEVNMKKRDEGFKPFTGRSFRLV